MRMKKNAAVVAGLAAVLALSPVAGPAVTAFAAGGTGTAVEEPAEKVKVTFHFGDGIAEDKVVEVDAYGKVGLPKPYPDNPGYKLEGWYYDEGFTHKYYSNDKFTEDTTLYAKWVDRYCTVTFWNETSYEDMTDAEPYAVQEVEYGYSAKQPEQPTREGYKFEWWYTDKECTERYNFRGVKGDENVYAKWTKFPVIEYYLSPESEEPFRTVVIDLNNTSSDEQRDMLNKSAVTKYLGDKIPEGYEIEGLYTDPDYTEKFTNFLSEVQQAARRDLRLPV